MYIDAFSNKFNKKIQYKCIEIIVKKKKNLVSAKNVFKMAIKYQILINNYNIILYYYKD